MLGVLGCAPFPPFFRTFRVAGVYLLDAQFLDDPTKFFSGMLSAMSTMVTLEVPHVNVLTKMVRESFENDLIYLFPIDPKHEKKGGPTPAARSEPTPQQQTTILIVRSTQYAVRSKVPS